MVTPASSSPWQRTAEHAERLTQRESHFYFRFHVFLFVVGVLSFLVTLGWLLWRLSVGGLFEMALVPLVGTVLLSILLVAGRCLFIIALDGPEKETVFSDAHFVPLERKPVTVSRFLVDRSRDIGPLSRRTNER